MIKKTQKVLNVLQAGLDLLSVLVALVLSWYIRFYSGIIPVWFRGTLPFWDYFNPVLMFLPVFGLSFYMFSLYNPKRKTSYGEEVFSIVKATTMGFFIFILFLFLSKQMHYSRVMLALFIVLVNGFMVLERIVIRKSLRSLRSRGYNMKHILLVGDSAASARIIRAMRANRHWGYNVIGVINDQPVVPECEVPYKGTIMDLERTILEENIDEVFVTLELNEYHIVERIIKLCEKLGVKTYIVPDYYRYLPARPFVEDVEGIPIINIRYIPLDNPLAGVLKRIVDIVISLTAILLLSPLLLLVALLIRMDSDGPVIFVQERVGLNRKPFRMYKFRSMRMQTDEEENEKWTTPEDPRKTRIGSFIRRTSIDELPQLFNVLKGNMSIVGPRPERPYFVDKFKEEVPKYMVKHQVRPGITGWAQIQGWRGDTSIVKRIECDIYYIENWSLWFDIKIMFLTLFKGLAGKNAY